MWFVGHPDSNHMKKYKKTKSSRDGLEILETRRLLSSAVVTGANLNLVGDANQSNSFLVRAAPSSRVLGFSNNFGRVAPTSTVQTVVIHTGNDTDTVTVAAGVTTAVEVIGLDGTTTWLKAGTTTTFGGPTNGGTSGTGSTGSGSDASGGSSNSGSGTSSGVSGSTGSGTGTSGSGTGSTGSGTSGSGTGSTGSGTGTSGSGTGSTGSGTGTSGSGSGSSGSGTGTSGSGTGSTGSGTGTSGSGTGTSGSGSGSTGTGTSGSGSGSTGSGTGSTGSGTTTTPNDPTGPTTPSNPSSSTPSPVITVTSPSTILPQESVNVQAIASSFGSGTSINSTIAWNFGDAGSAYNNLVGFNAAHAYASAGTYTITLTITTPDGHVGVATTQVVISPDNRPTIYVAANGSDSNNGSSASSPIQSITRLNQLLTSNTRVLFRDGDTFDMGSGVVLNVGGMSHVYIGSYGSGAEPILMYNGPATEGVLIGLSGSTSNLVVQGLTFNSIYSNNNASKAIPSAFYMQGNDITISNNTFLNLLSDLGAAANAPTNVLVQNNSSPDATGLNAYFYFVGGNEIVVLGNTVADSVGEAVLRVGGAHDILIADNNFREVPGFGTTSGGKNILSIQEGTYAYIYNNTLNTDPVEIGPIGTSNAVKTGIFQFAVFDSNTLINGAELCDRSERAAGDVQEQRRQCGRQHRIHDRRPAGRQRDQLAGPEYLDRRQHRHRFLG